MRIAFALLILAITLLFTSTAQANCFWEINARLEGFQPAVGPFESQRWPAANMEVRVQARWSSGGWWNGPNWPATRSNSAGEFSVRTTGAFPDPDCQTDRDFRVQVRAFHTGNQWTTVHQQSVSGPNGMQGIFIPAPVHSTRIGDVICDDDGCELGIIRVMGLTPPAGDWGPANPEENDPPADDTIAEEPTHWGGRNPQAAENPCAHLRSPFANGVEFRFGQLPASTPPAVSADQALRTELRSNSQGVTLNRIRNHVLIENAGSRDYNPDPRCRSRISIRVNEGPGRRGEGDAGWSNPTLIDMPAIAINATAPAAANFNLLGAGDVLQGNWDTQWNDGEKDDGYFEFALIEVVLDSTNVIQEAAEGDNMITHCYHAPQNAFVAMSNCPSNAR
jgi:hypothetical protein